jgi:hypothetical protein
VDTVQVFAICDEFFTTRHRPRGTFLLALFAGKWNANGAA